MRSSPHPVFGTVTKHGSNVRFGSSSTPVGLWLERIFRVNCMTVPKFAAPSQAQCLPVAT